jgi:hypothetical protein
MPKGDLRRRGCGRVAGSTWRVPLASSCDVGVTPLTSACAHLALTCCDTAHKLRRTNAGLQADSSAPVGAASWREAARNKQSLVKVI